MSMRKRRESRQEEMFVQTSALPDSPGHPFYTQLNELLAVHGFDLFVEERCSSYYAETLGRPSIPPGVYFRMLMIGYFEGLGSERGIDWRVADSLALRQFLGYALTETTPDHSSLSRIRQRLPLEVHQEVFNWVLKVLALEGLLKGKSVAVDATTLEANAALRSIVRRDTGEDYRRRHVLLQLRDRAEPQVYVEGVGQQRHDVALAQPVGARQQPHPGLHGGTKGAARYPFGPLGLAQHLALWAAQGMQLIFGNPSSHRRDVDDLVALRMRVFSGQSVTAVATARWLDRYHRVHPFHRQQRASMAFVSRLSAGRAARRTVLGTFLCRSGRGCRLVCRGAARGSATRSLSGQLFFQLHHTPLEVQQRNDQHLYRSRCPLPVGVGYGKASRFFHQVAPVVGGTAKTCADPTIPATVGFV